jgi:hypothetical protein
MKRPVLAAVVLAASALAVACSSTPVSPSIAVEGVKNDVKLLSGKWKGEYESKQNGRSGSIIFEFKSGNEGHGDVLMWPKGSKEPIKPAAGKDLSEEQIRNIPQVLTVSFVRSEKGLLTGTMDPYTDPDCNCDVRTTFAGTIDGDVITGEFTIERWDHTGPQVKGTWHMKREAS